MRKLFVALLVASFLLAAVGGVSPTSAQSTGANFSIEGAPSNVTLKFDAQYVSSIDPIISLFVAEPGVRTADPGDEGCIEAESCWHISPDVQFKLTDPEEEIFDLREDAWGFITWSHGVLTIGDVTIELSAEELHNWSVVLRGMPPGEGDHNVPVSLTNYDAGFGLATNLPVGARFSEDYLFQNTANTYNSDVCGGGCKSNSVLMYNVGNGAWAVIFQAQANSPWILIDTNINRGEKLSKALAAH